MPIREDDSDIILNFSLNRYKDSDDMLYIKCIISKNDLLIKFFSDPNRNEEIFDIDFISLQEIISYISENNFFNKLSQGSTNKNLSTSKKSNNSISSSLPVPEVIRKNANNSNKLNNQEDMSDISNMEEIHTFASTKNKNTQESKIPIKSEDIEDIDLTDEVEPVNSSKENNVADADADADLKNQSTNVSSKGLDDEEILLARKRAVSNYNPKSTIKRK